MNSEHRQTGMKTLELNGLTDTATRNFDITPAD